jgi:HK97 family phage major capsid protein
VEAFADIDGLTSELTRELADAKDRAECTVFTKGVGTTEPTGVVTSVYGVSTRRANHATNSAMTVTDITDAQNLLLPRFQPNASWIASLTYLNRARLLGSSSYSTWSATFDEPLASNILGKPAYEASDMSTALSSITNTAFVYGDFNHYIIPERLGMAVEYIPMMFSAGNALPNGRRGFYAYWRVGGDTDSVTAFVVSSNPGS